MGFMDFVALISVLALMLFSLLMTSVKHKWVKILLGIISVLIFLALGFKVVPGFENQLLIDSQTLKSDSIPFFSSFNFDKTLAGMVFYLVVIPGGTLRISGLNIVKSIGITLAFSAAVLGAGSAYGTIEPNLTYYFGLQFILLFILMQLFSTCLTEEVLFRGVLQEKMYCLFSDGSVYQKLIPLITASVLFGLVHFGGGIWFVVAATFAGLTYGLVYQITRRIEVAVVAHTLFNLLHLVFFSYPFKAMVKGG